MVEDLPVPLSPCKREPRTQPTPDLLQALPQHRELTLAFEQPHDVNVAPNSPLTPPHS
jgi:hypothetical protein